MSRSGFNTNKGSSNPNKGDNLIINGDMRISQRGSSFATPAHGAYTLDRWRYLRNGSMIHTVSQDSDVPTFAESGYLFQNSLRLNLTTPDDSVGATDYSGITQFIEGYNFTKIAQKPFTLSFWVKATVAGVRSVAFKNSVFSKSYVADYTINAANVWEKKVITVIASPSSGTWNYTNGVGLEIYFALMTGSTYTTSTVNAWTDGDYNVSPNTINGTATGNTDFRLTGVMLNEGPSAAPFGLFGKTIDGEISACQRYYEVVNIMPNSYGAQFSVNTFWGSPIFFSEKRALPSATYQYTSLSQYWVTVGSAAYSAFDSTGISLNVHFTSCRMNQPRVAGNSNPTVGGYYIFEAGFNILVNAEL